jgi:zinc protease
VPAGNVPPPTRRAYDRRAAPLVGVAAAIVATGASVARPPMYELSAHRLDNGVTLVHAARPGPVAAVEVWVGAGAADEPAGRPGVAHAVEHMLFRARDPDGGASALAAAIDRIGGEVNAWTSFDATSVHAVVPARALGRGLAAIAHALVHPRLSPDDLDAERGVLAAELRARAAEPATAAAHALFRQLFLVHPYRRPVVGTLASIEGLATGDLEAFFHSWYAGANTIAVVVADADPADVWRAALPLAAMPVRPIARSPRAEPAQRAARIAVERTPRGAGALTAVALGLRTAGAADPDRTALELLAAAIDARAEGELSAAHHILRDAGALIVTRTASAAVAGVADEVLAALAALGAELDDAELDRAVAAVEAGELRHAETAPGLARQLALVAAELDAGALPIARVAGALAARRAERAHRRRSLAPDAVRAVARARLRPPQIAIAALSPRRAAARPIARALDRHLGGTDARGVRRRARTAVAAAAPTRATPTLAPTTSSGASAARTVRAAPTTSSGASAARTVRAELDNGVVVVVQRDPRASIVAMRALWPGGARLEDDATAGATALLARAITRGCGDRDAAGTATAVADLGGVLAGTAGRNAFGLHAEWPARQWRAGLDLLADCALAPRLAADDVAAARRAQLAELAAVAGEPTRAAFRLFADALYRDHPYHLDPLGTEASVAALTAADVRALHRDRYPASRLVLVIVGDVDPDAALAAATARFGGASRALVVAPRAAGPVLAGRPAAEREVFAYRAGGDAQVVIGFPGAVVGADDRHALAVLAAILDGPTGRLFADVRDGRGLAYDLGVHAVPGVDPGYLAIHVACAPADLDATVAAVRAALDAFRDDGPTAGEVAAAARRLAAAHARAAERRADVAHGLAFAEVFGLGWQAWERTPDALAAVTVDDVADAARRYLRWDRAVIATVRPPAETPGAERRGRVRRETPRDTAERAEPKPRRGRR